MYRLLLCSLSETAWGKVEACHHEFMMERLLHHPTVSLFVKRRERGRTAPRVPSKHKMIT